MKFTPAMVNQLHACKLLRIEMVPSMKYLLVLIAMLGFAFSASGRAANGQPASGTARTPQEQSRISEAPDPATPFLVGAGLITVSVVIRRRRKLRSKESATTKVNRREDS